VLGYLVEIHGEATVRQSRDPQVQKTHDPELTTTPSDSFRNHQLVIDAGWKAAVESENWLAVKQFLSQEAPVDLQLLHWPANARLFDYSVIRNDTDLLQLFMGDTSASIRSQILSPYRSHYPHVPEPNNEFSVDVSHLWDITRKVRHDRVLGDDEESYSKSDRGAKKNHFRWDKHATVNSNSKARAKTRKRIFLSYTKAKRSHTSTQDHLLRELWSDVIGMDFQTANFYFGVVGKTPSVLPSTVKIFRRRKDTG
jgi:hypothetical protein